MPTQRRIDELLGTYDFYVESGWSKFEYELFDKMKQLRIGINMVSAHIEEILTSIIREDRGFRMFLTIHSVFPVKPVEDLDWLEVHMAKLLQPNEKEIAKLRNLPELPDEVLKMLGSFECDWVLFEKYPLQITYKMWGNPKKNPEESYDPVFIRDISFEQSSDNRNSVSEFLESFDDIYL